MTEVSKDTLWKGIIEDLFEDFIRYFYPDWARETIDFSKGFTFLDKELDQLYPIPKGNKKRFADKLVQVHTKQGQKKWILIHIEIQGYQDSNFPERMFTYFYRIRECYKQDLTALAVFTDDNPAYHPKSYVYEFHKTKAVYTFDTFKLLEKTEGELDIPDNPFSIVMLTARKALTAQNLSDQKQFLWKKALVLALKDANYTEEKIRIVLNFIRFYVKFVDKNTFEVLDKEIEVILKQRRNMGIEEAILEEVKERVAEKVTKEVTKKVTKQVTQQVTEQVTQQVTQQVTLQTKVRGIQKALLQGKLGLEDIAELFEVSTEFVVQVKNGEVKL